MVHLVPLPVQLPSFLYRCWSWGHFPVHSTSCGRTKFFPRWCSNLLYNQRFLWVLFLPHPQQHSVSSGQNIFFVKPGSVMDNFNVILVLISLSTGEISRLFTCLLLICISSSVNCLFISLPIFFYWVITFSWLVRILHILIIAICYANILMCLLLFYFCLLVLGFLNLTFVLFSFLFLYSFMWRVFFKFKIFEYIIFLWFMFLNFI